MFQFCKVAVLISETYFSINVNMFVVNKNVITRYISQVSLGVQSDLFILQQVVKDIDCVKINVTYILCYPTDSCMILIEVRCHILLEVVNLVIAIGGNTMPIFGSFRIITERKKHNFELIIESVRF